MEVKRNITLNVSELQLEAIRHFFMHNEWEFDFCESPVSRIGGTATVNKTSGVDKDTQTEWNISELRVCQSAEHGETEDPFVISQNEDAEECPFCLCKPCITDERNRQMWWETETYLPHQRNSRIRKDKYRRFWTMLLHRGVWDDQRYIERKQRALEHDGQNQEWHRRDILPSCVVNLVRGWLPNPKDKPYMGHLWE